MKALLAFPENAKVRVNPGLINQGDIVRVKWDVVLRIVPGVSTVARNPPGMGQCWTEGTFGTTIVMRCQTEAENSAGTPSAVLLWGSGHGAHPVLGVTEAVRSGESARVLVGPTSIAWYMETANTGSLSVVRVADLRWP